jgi:3-isopropylmalate/(R)-2-methylmalate dehydratase small subunit
LPIECGRPVDPLFHRQVMTIDLLAQNMSVPGRYRLFHLDKDCKIMLIEGLDAIDLTLKHRATISDWQAADKYIRPWVYL